MTKLTEQEAILDIIEVQGKLQRFGMTAHTVHQESLNSGINALHKQIAKKPRYKKVGQWEYPECPNGCVEFGHNRPNYCECCGQRIDWGDEE